MLRAGSEKGRGDTTKHTDQLSPGVTNSTSSCSPEPDRLSVITLQPLVITRYHRYHILGA